MKTVIYYEGDSERSMFNHIFYRSNVVINKTEDYMDFLTAPEDPLRFGHWVYLYDCGGHQNVFPRLSETEYLYREEVTVIIVRDLENVLCYRLLKDELKSACPSIPPFPRTRVVFSKKKFEQIYSADLKLFRDVFCKLYLEHFHRDIDDINLLEERIRNLNPEKPDLRSLFAVYHMAYKKLDVADYFFSQFDFKGSRHPYIVRLIESLGELAL